MAALIEAALGRDVEARAKFTVKAVSPGMALKYASDIASVLDSEVTHDIEHCWFTVADHAVVIYYDEPEVQS